MVEAPGIVGGSEGVTSKGGRGGGAWPPNRTAWPQDTRKLLSELGTFFRHSEDCRRGARVLVRIESAPLRRFLTPSEKGHPKPSEQVCGTRWQGFCTKGRPLTSLFFGRRFASGPTLNSSRCGAHSVLLRGNPLMRHSPTERAEQAKHAMEDVRARGHADIASQANITEG